MQQIIDQTVAFVKQELAGAEGGHDWWHIYRVWQLARHIAATETVNLLVVELGALLHDIADAKFHNGDENIGPAKATAFLESLSVQPEIIAHVENIIRHISFKGGNHERVFYSAELGVVQDADRLDAIGAIGIARAFNYGGFRNRALHDPAVTPNLQMTREEYKKNTAPTITHFYEKLLLLKDRMNTDTGKTLAAERHAFMELFLERFYQEWEGVL
ncbi:HD domain-containing protein [Chitinophaga nivalis]|uniref:HD domain-containing protein n=1 Tax=Chitinophaga nivalis TaxID=2991709 RepID=A0ABT3IRZ2_9BACT|nr:HD domain-containing protein [Chitinophaga nivalis]MCW3463564.1 HD domain-containing protein [Chitinophaga nivalis]MCW3486746.1 HD domain-containing protein [Chitinophaga nivalis]